MNRATLSADVISYTALTENEKRKLESAIVGLLNELSVRYADQSFFGRLVQGDYIECAMQSPKYALRIALLIKTFVKSFGIDRKVITNSRLKYFFEYGVRLAVAVAPLEKLDRENGIIDGEAIYLSGRAIKNQSTSDKQKIIIKNTLFFCSPDKELTEQFDTLFALLDTLLSTCSAKQSQILYFKLLDLSEKEISEKLKKSQSTISQHSTAAGWLAIDKAVRYFENTIK
jgi:hypothetical protein